MIHARAFRRNFPHSDISMEPESGVVSIEGDLDVSGSITSSGGLEAGSDADIDTLTVSGDVNFDGSVLPGLFATDQSADKLGFFGATPVVKGSNYTQTYSTADKTHANPTASTLTVADGAGTNDNTIGAITADASVIAAVQEIVDEVNKLIADVADVKQLVNSVIDDLQLFGLVGP
jgi:hypothetical protein